MFKEPPTWQLDVDLMASGDLQVPASSASSASNEGGAESRLSGRSSGEGELVLGLSVGVGAYGHDFAERRRQPAALELSTRTAAETGAGAARTSTTPATPVL